MRQPSIAALLALSGISMASCGGDTPSHPPLAPTAVPSAPPATVSPAVQLAQRAEALSARGVIDRAAGLYQEAFAIEPRPGWLLARAELLADAWDFANAVEAFDALLKLPNLAADAKARANQGRSNAKQQAATPPAKLSDSEQETLDAAQRASLQSGKIAEARARLEKVVQGPQDETGLYDELAVLQWIDNQPVQAQKTWARGRSSLTKEQLGSLEILLMPPIGFQTRVMALQDGVAITETIDPGLIRYDTWMHRFLGPDEFADDAKQIVTAGQGARAFHNGALVIAANFLSPVPFDAGMMYPGDQEEDAEPDHPTAVALSPDGTHIAWGASDGGVRIAALSGDDYLTRAGLDPLPKNAAERKLGTVVSLAFDPKAERVAVGHAKGAVRVLTKRGRQLADLKGNTAAVYALSFTPDGARLASGAADGSLRLWDVANKKELAKLSHPEPVFYVRGVGPSEVDFASRLGVRRTKLPADGKPKELLSGNAEIYDVLAVSDSPDGSTRATSHFKMHAIQLWDRQTGAAKGEIRADNQAVSDFALSPDGRFFAAVGDDDVHIFDSKDQSHRRFHLDDVQSVAFSPDSALLAAAGFGEQAVLWDLKTQKEARRVALAVKGQPVDKLDFTEDGQTLAVEHAGGIKMYDVATGKLGKAPADAVSIDIAPRLMAVTDRGKTSWGGEGGHIRVLRDGRPLFSLKGAAPLDLAQQSRWLAARDDYDVVVWDETGAERFRSHAQSLRLVALPPSGTSLAVGFDNGWIEVVDTATKKVKLSALAHNGLFKIKDLAWVADGKVLVTGGHDGIKLWSPERDDPLLATLRLTSDGWYLVTHAGMGSESASVETAGFSKAVVSDVLAAWFSGGLVWEGLRDDRILGDLLHCGRPHCAVRASNRSSADH